MKVYNVIGSDVYRILLPDYEVFIGDSNLIEISSMYEAVGGRITISNSSKTLYYRYMGNQKRIMFDITAGLRLLYDSSPGEEVIINVGVLNNNTTDAVVEQHVKLYDGVTLAGREHGSESVIYTSSLQQDIDIFYTGAQGSIGTHNVSRGITKIPVLEGKYCFDTSIGAETDVEIAAVKDIKTSSANISLEYTIFDSPEVPQTATLWDKGSCIEFISQESCAPPDATVTVRYKNSDGCMRYLTGTLLTETQTSEVETYSSLRTPIRGFRSSLGRSIIIGFKDIDTKHSSAMDITLNNNLEYYFRNSWNPAVLDTLEVTAEKKNGIRDIEITLKIQ